MKKGFTLIEVLVVVVIVGVLASLALPTYRKSMEKARGTEAMNMVKAVNDAVYAYAAERNKCPESFNKILVKVPGVRNNDLKITGKYFVYHLNAATNAPIPGTSCGGLLAERIGGTYKIWNPYADTTGNQRRTLACTASTSTGIEMCKAMGIYVTTSPN
ncbi:MAG: prepilin-type N-terminal cleavage/methylation domain-containing protein [Elusimicrobiaceae bacterium]|nr:prepilin-type N-terminal cleavage/methylation domain-containing protein [Elusimicrobiaceae bacterium]